MIASQTQPTFLAGQDTRALALPQSFYKLKNISWRKDLSSIDTAWGFEPLYPYYQGRDYSPLTITSVCDLWAFYTNAGRTEWLVQERDYVVDGVTSRCLYYEMADGHVEVLDQNRNTTARTQMVQFGRMAIFLNGINKMIKFFGDKQVTPFGFTSLPPAPQLIGVDPTRVVPDSSSNLAADNDNELNDQGQGIALFPHCSDDTSEWDTDSTRDYVLPSGYTLTLNSNVGVPKPTSYWGLGTIGEGDRNTYSYKVSYVSDTGSESPLSEAATVSWVVPTMHDAETGGANEGKTNPFAIKLGVQIQNLPTGDNHIVARRIYRTRNKADGLTGNGDNFFLVKEIRDNITKHFIDFIPDNELIVPAPGVSDSYIIPGTYKLGTVWDGRLWLAGGEGTENEVRWSAQGRPEQFGGFNFFDTGVRGGGPITALHPFENGLYVFREQAIDIIIRGPDGSYQIGTVSDGIGTKSPNAVSTIPGLGTIFLSFDGVYVISGGAITKISDSISHEIQKLNQNRIELASAVYSKKWDEWFLLVPGSNSKVLNTGLVYHPQLGGWSTRGSTGATSDKYWSFNKLVVDRFGDILVAPNLYYDDDIYTNIGVHVVSRCNRYPEVFAVDDMISVGDVVNFADPIFDKVESEIISQFVRWGDKKVSTISAMLNCYQTQIAQQDFHWLFNNRVRVDDDWKSTAALMHPDEYNSTGSDSVWDSTTGLDYEMVATNDSTIIANNRLVATRFDLQTYARESTAWRWKSTDRMVLNSWSFAFNGTGITTKRGE